MRQIAGHKFPQTSQEARDWIPTVHWRPLARRVLAVAETRLEGTWAAYCDSVPGINHDNEIGPVLTQGAKLHEDVARAIFPRFADLPYAR